MLDIQIKEKKKQEEAAREEQNAHGELAKCGFLTYVTSIQLFVSVSCVIGGSFIIEKYPQTYQMR